MNPRSNYNIQITKLQNITKLRKEKRKKRKLSQNRASIFRSQTRHGIFTIFASRSFSLIYSKTKEDG